MKATWITDPHLSHLPQQRDRFYFYDAVREQGTDVILVSGDVGSAMSAFLLLAEMSARTGRRVMFVFGNHDYYGDSIEDVQAHVPKDGRVIYLPEAGVVGLTDKSCVVGQGGWGDGQYGNATTSPILLADWQYIWEFHEAEAAFDVEKRLKLLRSLANAEAKILEADLETACERFRHIYIVTHVPPFPEATWHEGKRSDDDWLPWFTCKAIGDVIMDCVLRHRHRQFEVLCGHTHGGGTLKPPLMPNLIVRTGEARYGSPRIARSWEVP